MRKCPVNGCNAKVRRGDLMCFKHWMLVPKTLRQRVWSEFKQEPGSDSHQMACQAATEAVNETVGMEEKAKGGKGKAEC